MQTNKIKGQKWNYLMSLDGVSKLSLPLAIWHLRKPKREKKEVDLKIDVATHPPLTAGSTLLIHNEPMTVINSC